MRLLFLSERKELRRLSKNQLIDMFLEEQKARQEIESRLKKVEHYLKAFDNAHTPSSKQLKNNTKNEESESEDDSSDEEEKKPRFPGKPKGSNGGGIKLPKPDKVEEHTLKQS